MTLAEIKELHQQKMQERENLTTKLTDTCQYLSNHFQDRPECRSLIGELKELDRVSSVIERENNAQKYS